MTPLAQGPDGLRTAYDLATAGNGGGGDGGVVPRWDAYGAALAGAADDAAPCRSWSQQQFWLVLADIHRDSYASLVRLAALYLDGAGEDAVQDAFVQVSKHWDRITDADKVLLYLRRAVVNRSKSLLRHRLVVRRHEPVAPFPAPASEDVALRHLGDEALVARVRRLPERQRACVGLRFCLNLSVKETAEILDISTGSVKQHTSRALRKLGPALESYL